MVRAPCCEKVGLKKGPWTTEEDQILINHIQNFGHANWRALPRHAGLLRCGKSCRLRWINYLRPDIKRGNFTKEEEDTIMNLHQRLGNRWSAIAGKLPGRTDNEIKNVWHTHLKKRLKQSHKETKADDYSGSDKFSSELPEPQQSNSSEFSSPNNNNESSVFSDETNANMDFSETFPEIDESFWSSSEVLFSKEEKEEHLAESSSNPFEVSEVLSESKLLSPFNSMNSMELSSYDYSSPNIIDDVDFWYDIFIRSGGNPKLSEF